ncbi:MAG: DUF4852 domain-containing protein [Alphaproteobacteria bacterium]|nr:DUF4852 domain-containing protein [Alphaproteobacteria bacterium]
MKKMLSIATFFLMLLPAMALAQNPPVRSYPDLTYVNVLQAMIKLGKFKPETTEFLDAYSMVAHCDVVQGSFKDEFRWNQARDAMKKYLAVRTTKFPTRLAVRSRIMFDRYDLETKYYLFSSSTPVQKINTFTTDTRPRTEPCERPTNALLPAHFQVITNNPVTLPGLRLSEEQAKDLRQKFEQAGNANRVAYIRFNIDVTDAEYIGPSVFATQQGAGDKPWKIKATMHSIEFFSDSQYRNRFFYYVPL